MIYDSKIERELVQEDHMKPSEKRLLEIIIEFTEDRGYCPTIRDLANVFSTSTSTIYYHLANMREKKQVEWQEGDSRTIRPVGYKLRLIKD